ncbi:MAG: Gfo/Idh/MocA family oxidoreductase [Planctomycetales bacterium]
MKNTSKTRRKFIQEVSAISAGLFITPALRAEDSKSANERIRFACIGIGGKGQSDSADAAHHGDVVAVCDIDENTLNTQAEKKFAKAARFTDYREMLDKMGKGIDAVTVSTPDHSHTSASVRAMRMGKHCFTQKPLTHSVSEARLMAKVAREAKVATQMGNQGTANDTLRQASAIIKSGALGTIKEVHVWTNRPVWPGQGGPRPAPTAVPKGVNWDLWIGPAPFRDYGPGSHTFAWRAWWDFGTGALGDMACHTFNMPYMALDLKNPTSIEAEHTGHNGDSYPASCKILFQFPSTSSRPAIPVTWYDGGNLPPEEILGGKKLGGNKRRRNKKDDEKDAGAEPVFPSSGVLVVGDKDILHGHGDYCGGITLLSGKEPPKVDFVKSPGHFEEFIRAIRGGEAAVSNFPEYSGGLTETILLGNLAVWCGKSPNNPGKKVEWDSEKLVAKGMPELDKIINPPYRKGWEL